MRWHYFSRRVMVDAVIGPCPENCRFASDAQARNPARGAGFFTVIDGQAGVGKTTVIALTAARLAAQDLPVLAIRQPSDSPIGTLARASTHNLHGLPLTFLMAADRYYHQEHVICPTLASGQIIVCDRYVTTAMVLDQMDGAEPEFVWSIYRYLIWPDLAIVLTGDPAVCRARAARRGIYSRFHEGGTRAAETEARPLCQHGGHADKLWLSDPDGPDPRPGLRDCNRAHPRTHDRLSDQPAERGIGQ
jgi:dTMP kinase